MERAQGQQRLLQARLRMMYPGGVRLPSAQCRRARWLRRAWLWLAGAVTTEEAKHQMVTGAATGKLQALHCKKVCRVMSSGLME